MLKKIILWLFKILLLCVAVSVLIVVLYRFIPPPITPLMVIRQVEGIFSGKSVGFQYSWIPIEQVSPSLLRAVIAAEDGKFLSHSGINWDAVAEARRRNEQNAARAARRGKQPRIYGASTITMQTAKNVFLPPSRNYIRKALEAYFTYLIEFVWGKRRILEVYVNVIEMGNGIYGAEAAARSWYGKSASALLPAEATAIAAILPDPRRRSPLKQTAYLQRRVAAIQSRMSGIALPK